LGAVAEGVESGEFEVLRVGEAGEEGFGVGGAVEGEVCCCCCWWWWWWWWWWWRGGSGGWWWWCGGGFLISSFLLVLFCFFEDFGVGAEVEDCFYMMGCCEICDGCWGGGCWEGGAVEEGGFEGWGVGWGVVYEG